MIEVRIRMDDEASARRLCDWPSMELDRLIPTLGRWGVICSRGEYGPADLVGQIQVDDDAAFFEVIIITEPDK